jgi:hypothetical protein
MALYIHTKVTLKEHLQLENTDNPPSLYRVAIFTKNYSEFMHVKNCFCNNIFVSSTGGRHNIHLQMTVLSV